MHNNNYNNELWKLKHFEIYFQNNQTPLWLLFAEIELFYAKERKKIILMPYISIYFVIYLCIYLLIYNYKYNLKKGVIFIVDGGEGHIKHTLN